MRRIEAVLTRFTDLDLSELTIWIDKGWVQPEPLPPDDWHFEEIDLARLHLVYDLRRRCEIDLDLMPLVLSLLDQVYELRSTLNAVSQAIGQQPGPIRDEITKALKTLSTGMH